MPADRLEQILSLLRERGGRVTTPRRAIIRALVDADGHVTADDIAEAVQRAHPDIHRSTVYRTLDVLAQLGVVVHVHLGHGAAVYHLADEAHHHLVCDHCGAVIELPSQVLASLGRRIERDYGFRLGANHFALGGRCTSCASRGLASRRGRAAESGSVRGRAFLLPGSPGGLLSSRVAGGSGPSRFPLRGDGLTPADLDCPGGLVWTPFLEVLTLRKHIVPPKHQTFGLVTLDRQFGRGSGIRGFWEQHGKPTAEPGPAARVTRGAARHVARKASTIEGSPPAWWCR